MPTVSIFSLRFSRLSIVFTYLSVNHTRDDLAEIADPRVQRQELVSGKKVYLNTVEKRKPQFANPGKNICHFSGLQVLNKMFMRLCRIAGGTSKTG